MFTDCGLHLDCTIADNGIVEERQSVYRVGVACCICTIVAERSESVQYCFLYLYFISDNKLHMFQKLLPV